MTHAFDHYCGCGTCLAHVLAHIRGQRRDPCPACMAATERDRKRGIGYERITTWARIRDAVRSFLRFLRGGR